VVREVPAGTRVIKLSVPSGRYLVRKQQTGGNYSREVTVEPDRSVTVDEADLTLSPFPRDVAKGFSDEARDEWPLALNNRPLALRAGMAEVDLGLSATTKFQENLPILEYSDLTTNGLAPLLRYGLTDRLTLSGGITGGSCAGTGCQTLAGLNAGALYLLTTGVFELGVLTSAELLSNAWIPASAGLTARLGHGHFASLQVTGTVQHTFNVSPPANTTLVGQNTYLLVSTVLLLQPFERISFDIGTQTVAANSINSLPVTFGVGFALNHRLDLRAQVTDNAVKVDDANGVSSVAGASFGLTLLFRP
jgi:hypothetical protein